MPATILIVDDEEDLLGMIRDALEEEGYRVLTASDGNAVFPLLRHRPDLIVLDIMMPGLDGVEVCRAIRDTVACPILFLSARQEVEDRIVGLAAGGDDYLIKPFSLRELKARIAAHLRREQRSAVGREMAVLRFGLLTVDLKQRRVFVRNREVPLTGKEFDLIRFLALHPGQVFSRDQIYEKVWGFGEGSDATVTEHVKRIRAKLTAVDPEVNPIVTVWGIGYRWETR